MNCKKASRLKVTKEIDRTEDDLVEEDLLGEHQRRPPTAQVPVQEDVPVVGDHAGGQPGGGHVRRADQVESIALL